MQISVARVTIRLPENDNLKGKRRVVKSICTRVHNKFNVSISEIDDNELWQIASFGIVCAGNSSRITEGTLNSVLDYINASSDDFEVIDISQESLGGF